MIHFLVLVRKWERGVILKAYANKEALRIIKKHLRYYNGELTKASINERLRDSNFGKYIENIQKYERIIATLTTMKRAFEKSQAVISNPEREYYQLCDEIMKVLNEIRYNINVDSQSGKVEFYKVQDA